jgi:hypothetical protein
VDSRAHTWSPAERGGLHRPTLALDGVAGKGASASDPSLTRSLLAMAPGYQARTVTVVTRRMSRKG